jgi:hypothetical protein
MRDGAQVNAIEQLRVRHSVDREEKATVARATQEEKLNREQEAQSRQDREAHRRADERQRLKEAFLNLYGQQDAQQRGYALEKLLKEVFALEGLSPRGSFVNTGEQIDGSFSWQGNTHLVEAKWTAERVHGKGFAALCYRMEGKSADTRGLFVAINGYSDEALDGLRSKGELRFICIDGAYLMRCLEPGGSLPQLLERLWRHAGEKGEAFLPIAKMHE